jgi:hypothetical protein
LEKEKVQSNRRFEATAGFSNFYSGLVWFNYMADPIFAM